MTIESDVTVDTWRDPDVSPADRVRDLMDRMSLTEKVAQLSGIWIGIDSAGKVAPHINENAPTTASWDELIADGVGQLTRAFGTAPIDPLVGANGLADSQRQVMAANRFRIPAMAHEECLTGLVAWQATIYPSPLCWGASFDPELVQTMAARIGSLMARLGVHQGLAPVLDVARDLRWGRVEETIGEDPHLVGMIGSAYVRGLESAGIVSTLKHFVGYSSSRAGRNLAPVSIGPRELADVVLPPFEMALRAGARSVMNSYTDNDGMPVAADRTLLTDRLRDTYGFTGTVVSDYFAVCFLEVLHHVAGSATEAAGLALAAGIDVELPMVTDYGDVLVAAVEAGDIDGTLVDRAVERVLRQKCELGLLDERWAPSPPSSVEMDDAESRSIALDLARRSIVLLHNDDALPLPLGGRVAVIGPQADLHSAMLGCYSFPMHVGVHHPDVPIGVEVPTVLAALRDDYDVTYAQGCPVLGGDDAGIAEAVRVAAEADTCVLVLGDKAGLFGGGTSGEGDDSPDLTLPGRQAELLEAVVATGTPVVLVLLVGRPYELPAVDRLAAVVCGFFLGEAGAAALAGVLSGRVNPSGRLPINFPRVGGSQPATYLAAQLGQRTDVSSVDPTPAFPFGHGLSYVPVEWVGVELLSGPEWATDGACQVGVTLRNDGAIATSEVIQVYLHDPVAEVARPVRQLVAAVRVDVSPGQTRTVGIELHADLTSYTGRAGRRIVDLGDVELHVGASSADIRETLKLALVGQRRQVGFDRVMEPVVSLD